MPRRTLMLIAVVATLLALPAAALAGTPVGQWTIDVRTDPKRAVCEYSSAIVTAETISWPGECTGKKKRSGSNRYTLTVLDPFGVVQATCTEKVKVPRKTTVPVGCSVANPGFPVG